MSNALTKDLILNNVEINSKTGCWLWLGYKGAGGYGTVQIKGKRFRAHRVTMHLWNNFDLKSSLLICHKCDVPACVNPTHLVAGTSGFNARDCKAKGRMAKVPSGTQHSQSKLNPDAVRLIRTLGQLQVNHNFIARAFNVSVGAIRKVLHGETWAHVQNFEPKTKIKYITKGKS